MRSVLKVATAQFENRSGDKNYNLSRIETLSRQASDRGAEVILFHEGSITGLTHAMNLSRDEMLDLAEEVPGGPSTVALQEMARSNNLTIVAGLFEKDTQGNLFKTQIAVNKDGLLGKFRKLHPFINPHLSKGNEYCIFDLHGWTCSILICYDNNVIENVRATRLLGTEVLFMPHVTMLTPSNRPGAGTVDHMLWHNRQKDPTSLRSEFDSLKGRQWLMKWLPARAYDNGVYVVFANAIGMEGGQLKNGCSMLLDPFGDVLAECRSLDDEIAIAAFQPEKLTQSGGYRYINSQRPEVYSEILSRPHDPIQKVAWMDNL